VARRNLAHRKPKPERSEPGYCHRCKRHTTWSGRGFFIKCEGCGEPFPCPGECSHADCAVEHGEMMVDERGYYRKVTK